jgi:hypothetical protein
MIYHMKLTIASDSYPDLGTFLTNPKSYNITVAEIITAPCEGNEPAHEVLQSDFHPRRSKFGVSRTEQLYNFLLRQPNGTATLKRIRDAYPERSDSAVAATVKKLQAMNRIERLSQGVYRAITTK